MDLLRRFITQPPDPRSSRDDKPTLLVSWWCTTYAITIILVRVCGRYLRTEKLFRDDGIMLLAILPLLMRMAFVHVILLYGTNNTIATGLTSGEIRQREIGSKLVLASRIMYAACLWAIKYSASMFLKTLTGHVWQRSQGKVLRYFHIFLAMTFVATVVSDLAECQPFTHYWQVVPDPGPQCRQAYGQFLTMTISNILTNVVLVVFPLPMIIKSSLPSKGKSSIILLMALPLINVTFTAGQIATILSHSGEQQLRSLLASVDILIATGTSNTIVLSSLLQDKGYKKTKYKYDVGGGELQKIRTNTNGRKAARNRWGSDEDLMRTTSDDRSSVMIGMETLSPDHADTDGNGLRVPPKARLQEIRVNQTWEIAIEDAQPKKQQPIESIKEVRD